MFWRALTEFYTGAPANRHSDVPLLPLSATNSSNDSHQLAWLILAVPARTCTRQGQPIGSDLTLGQMPTPLI